VTDSKRQQLKAKVAKGQARLRERQTWAERAAQARDTALDLARDHPLLVVAGGLALGFLVSTLFKRSPTRKLAGEVAEQAERGARKGGRLVWMAAEFALPFVQQALVSATETGRTGRDKLGDFGEAAGDRARKLGREATSRAEDTLEAARGAGRRFAKAVRH
jgi:hypothetical protein